MRRRTWLLAVPAALMAGCFGKASVEPASFVGRWRSSRSSLPIHLMDNGEWEIRRDNGEVLQYGVWQYQGGRIIWTFKADGDVLQEANAVLSVSTDAFSLRERDQSTTLFQRLP